MHKRLLKNVAALMISLLVLASVVSCGKVSSDVPENREQTDSQQVDEGKSEKEDSDLPETTEETAGTEDAVEEIEETVEEKHPSDGNTYRFTGKTAKEITAELTLEQKICQMLQPACYTADYSTTKAWNLGSVFGAWSDAFLTAEEWSEVVRKYQAAALESDAGLPLIYGQDDVHGINYCKGAVVFPHNIGLGAANDPDLMYEIGAAVADEAKMTGMLWNFAPCVAVSTDPRWGRTYESLSSNPEIVRDLAAAYTKSFTEQGAAACAKHFFADGSETWGTGQDGRLIDRGSAELTDEEIAKSLANLPKMD